VGACKRWGRLWKHLCGHPQFLLASDNSRPGLLHCRVHQVAICAHLPSKFKTPVAASNLGLSGLTLVLTIDDRRHFARLPPLLPARTPLQAVVNLDNVKSVPGLGEVTRIPFVTQVLQGILPTIGERGGWGGGGQVCCSV
jgi:hypothetical protein